jgi:predicted esterase YcpF (UPF0227 family)
MIIYFHGFSSSEKSHKANVIKEYFKAYEIYIPDYPSHQPRSSISYLENYIQSRAEDNPEQCIMLMGSSLGGFYAQYFASQNKTVVAAVLINPCLQPTITLASQVGEQVNSVTNKPFRFTKEDLQGFAQYDVPSNKVFYPTLLLLDEGDEFIDYRIASSKYRDKGRVIVYPGGDHWFRHLDEALPEIESFYKLHVKVK